MWQRTQTIFLAIAVVAMFLMIFFPIWEGSDGGERVVFYPFYLKHPAGQVYSPFVAIAILAIASITVGIIEIGRYRNRMLQIKLGALNSLLMAGTMVAAILMARNLQADLGAGAWGISLFMPAVGMICNSIANRFIRRDEQLVRESDRLR